MVSPHPMARHGPARSRMLTGIFDIAGVETCSHIRKVRDVNPQFSTSLFPPFLSRLRQATFRELHMHKHLFGGATSGIMGIGIGPVPFKTNICFFGERVTGLEIPTSLNRVTEIPGYILLL